MPTAEEQRHADALAVMEAEYRRWGMVLRADNMRAEIDRHLAAVEPAPDPGAPPSGFDPSAVDWERPPVVGPITTPGLVVRNQLVHATGGRLSVRAPDVLLENAPCVGVSLAASGEGNVIDATSTAAKRFRMVDCLVTIPTPDARWARGVFIGPDATLERVTVKHAVDGYGWYDRSGGDVEPVQIDCQAYDLTWFAVDPLSSSHPDGTHNDAIQAHSPIGPGARVIGGYYDAGPKGTAPFLAAVASIRGLVISGADLRGGRCAFNIGPVQTVQDVALTHNVIASPVVAYVSSAGRPGVVALGNVRPDGSPANTLSSSGS